ncbi:MAG: hypothetical protein LBJ46_11725 [Planctomycetota bacterium]|jgi:hypothetical protein|nr:hypothetical protein [Planctomycetota bacterium]
MRSRLDIKYRLAAHIAALAIFVVGFVAIDPATLYARKDDRAISSRSRLAGQKRSRHSAATGEGAAAIATATPETAPPARPAREDSIGADSAGKALESPTPASSEAATTGRAPADASGTSPAADTEQRAVAAVDADSLTPPEASGSIDVAAPSAEAEKTAGDSIPQTPQAVVPLIDEPAAILEAPETAPPPTSTIADATGKEDAPALSETTAEAPVVSDAGEGAGRAEPGDADIGEAEKRDTPTEPAIPDRSADKDEPISAVPENDAEPAATEPAVTAAIETTDVETETIPEAEPEPDGSDTETPAPTPTPSPAPVGTATSGASAEDAPESGELEPALPDEKPDQPEEVIAGDDKPAALQPDESGALVVAEDASPATRVEIVPVVDAGFEMLADGVYWLTDPAGVDGHMESIPPNARIVRLSASEKTARPAAGGSGAIALPTDLSCLGYEAAAEFLDLAFEKDDGPLVAVKEPGADAAAFYKGAFLLTATTPDLEQVLRLMESDLAESGQARDDVVRLLSRLDAAGLRREFQ